MRSFIDVSRGDARKYFDHVVARHHTRLVDLAHHLAATGGPIDLMDGSPDSTIELWVWFTSRLEAGVPEIAADAQPDAFRFLALEPGPYAPAYYAAETLAHYLYEAVSLVEPQTRWQLDDGLISAKLIDASANLTGIASKPGRSYAAEEYIRNFTFHYLNGMPLPATKLKDVYEAALGVKIGSTSGRRGSSILAPLLSEPVVSATDPRRQPPIADPLKDFDFTPPADPQRIVTADGVFHGKGMTGEPSAAWPALDWDHVAASLRNLGAKERGSSIPPGREINRGIHEYEIGEREALATTYGVHRRLRGISITALEADSAQWDRIDHEMRRLADEMGAEWEHNG